jgi:hypothetical protein
MTRPPPIPNKPANKPAAEPTNKYTKNVILLFPNRQNRAYYGGS